MCGVSTEYFYFTFVWALDRDEEDEILRRDNDFELCNTPSNALQRVDFNYL